MRRRAIAALATASPLGFPAVAAAGHSSGIGSKDDFVVGSARVPAITPFGQFPSQQQVGARAVGRKVPGLGAPAKGWFRARVDVPDHQADFRGRVLCIDNVGKTSIIAGPIIESTEPLVPAGFGVTHRLVDNDDGRNAPRDEFGGMVTGPPSGGGDCPQLPLGMLPTLPIEQGNLVVHDAGAECRDPRAPLWGI